MRFERNRCVIRISFSRQTGSKFFPLYGHVTFRGKKFMFVRKAMLVFWHWEWGILLAERLGERDVKKVSMNQTSVARLGAKKHYHFLLMGTCL